jgi:hypothetical protein
MTRKPARAGGAGPLRGVAVGVPGIAPERRKVAAAAAAAAAAGFPGPCGAGSAAQARLAGVRTRGAS